MTGAARRWRLPVSAMVTPLRSFGWTLEMRLLPEEFIQAFLGALVAALLAGLYPAWRIGQTQPAEALRSE